MKQIVVFKNSKTIVTIFSEYLIVKINNVENIIAYKYILELYINKNINISISNCIKLASLFDVWFINHHGKILAKVELDEKI